MACQSGLGLCVDECLGRHLASSLRNLHAPGGLDIHDTRDLKLSGMSDEVLFGELTKLGFRALVTKDSRILAAAARRHAWRASGLHIFFLHGKAGNLPLFEQARRIIWCWPRIVSESRMCDPPRAWRVSHEEAGGIEPYPAAP
jgi:hypothetical protein